MPEPPAGTEFNPAGYTGLCRKEHSTMGSYQEHALESASAVELVVALYDGMIRFLYAAAAAVERGDQVGRRVAVKRALDIIIHLQARLRMDVGGAAGAGAERVLRHGFRADSAGFAVGLQAKV